MNAVMTAEQLNITQKEYDGLLWVRDLLKSKKLVYIDDDEFPEGRNAFNMSLGHKRYECGSVACVGGWVWVHMNLDKVVQSGGPEFGFYEVTEWQASNAHDYVYNPTSGRLSDLYFPPSHINYESITAEQAVEAIDNFLRSGEPDWEGIWEERGF